jgi:hypothetical protein
MIYFHCIHCNYIGKEALLSQRSIDMITFNSLSTNDYDIREIGEAMPDKLVCPDCFEEIPPIREDECLKEIND